MPKQQLNDLKEVNPHGIPHLVKKLDTWLLMFLSVWEKHIFFIKETPCSYTSKTNSFTLAYWIPRSPRAASLVPKDLKIGGAPSGSRVSSQALADPHVYSHAVILTVLPSLLWTHRGSLGERWKTRTTYLITQHRETWEPLVRTEYGSGLQVLASWR